MTVKRVKPVSNIRYHSISLLRRETQGIIIRYTALKKMKNRKYTVKYNSVIIIESLVDEDHTALFLSEFINDGLKPLLGTFKDKIEYWPVSTKKQFLQKLSSIISLIDEGNYLPIVHIECHGSTDKKGFIIGPNEEFVSWNETSEIFRKINFKLKNSLIITLGVCHGINLHLIMEAGKSSPFFLLLAPNDSLCPCEVLKGSLDFYSTLLNEKNIAAAINKTKENTVFKLFTTEGLLKIYLSIIIEEFNIDKILSDQESIGIQNGHEFDREKMKPIIENDVKLIIKNEYEKYLLIDKYPETRNNYLSMEELVKEII